MRFALDIAVLVAIGLFAVVGAKKGFIKSCADFLGAFAAMIGAGILSGPAAQWVYDTFFHTALMEKIAAAITGLDTAEAVQTVFRDFPEVIQRGLLAAGITEGSVMAQLQGSALDVAEGIAMAISPMLIDFIRVLAMVVLFILLLVVIRAVALLLSGMFSLPLLHGLNSTLGAVFGVLLAIVAIWVVLACVQAFAPMLSVDMQERIARALEQSVFFSALYDFNPAYTLIG